MNNGNYIKVCRSLLNWEWYSNINTKAVFLHCLLKANWKDGRFEGVDIPRGSFATSLPKMSEELGLSEHQIRTALNHLKLTGELTVKTYSKFRVITINNYSQYQDDDRQVDRQVTGKRQTSDRQVTAIEERKKERREEGKKENNIGRFTPPTANEVREYCINGGYNIDPDAFIDFYESKGWMVGKNKMKDWRAAVRNWSRQGRAAKTEQRQGQTADVFDEWRNA